MQKNIFQPKEMEFQQPQSSYEEIKINFQQNLPQNQTNQELCQNLQQEQQWSNSSFYYQIDDYFTNRLNILPEIQQYYKFNPTLNIKNSQLINFLCEKKVIVSQIVENVMKSIDRADFVKINPYFDSSQPLGFSVVVSAPHIHAYALVYYFIIYNTMKEILKDACFKSRKCLDVGSGTGYLTLALAKMLEKNKGTCYGIEHIPQLVKDSYANIKKSHIDWLESKRVQIFEGEGRLGLLYNQYKVNKGLPEYGPFDVIHVGAGVNSVNEVPRALLDQLMPGGRMLIPIGLPNDQQFVAIDKDIFGNYNLKGALGVCFVPLTSKYNQLTEKNQNL